MFGMEYLSAKEYDMTVTIVGSNTPIAGGVVYGDGE
jgi:hypothetical protein